MYTLLTRLAVLCALLGATPLPAQTLKIATIAPEGSSWMSDLRAGAAEIQQRTDGRVKLKFYGGGVQGNDRQVQRKMRTGQLHGGAFTSMNKFQRDADLYALPLMFNSIDEVRHVRSRLDSVLRQRLEDAGFVNFGFAGGGFAYMMSNRPLRTLDDLNGQKVWIPEGDEIGYAALRALGIAPVSMPVTDVLTGLQTDLLNSVTVPPVGAVVLQWHTRLKYITDLPVAYVYAAILIERRAFERLSPEDQAVVREVLEGVYRRFDENGAADNEQALQALLESGLERVTPDADQVRAWQEIVTGSNEQQVRAGVIDADLLHELQRLLAAYRSRPSPQAMNARH
jgi:TRAP-type C4-dicarboxylate transport system substrate-binding protein